MKKLSKYIRLYAKFHRAINAFYNFSLKGKYGEQVPEDLNWFERTDYYLKAE